MSSIIDALKKSDANRPKKDLGVNMRMAFNKQNDGKKRWGFYTLVIVLLLLLAAVYFRKPEFIWQHVGSAEQVTPSVQSTPSQVKTTHTTDQKQNRKLDKPVPAQVQSALKNQTTNKDSQPQQISVSESNKIQPDVVQENDDITSQARIRVENTATDNEAKSNEGDYIDNTTDQVSQQTKQQIDQQLSATPMKNKQALTKSAEDKRAPSSATSELPQLFELPYSIRKDIPKMTISVHVYDPVVENRMAIINGVPIHVGDTFEEVVTIQDITQSGVVLRIQDRDFIVLK